MQLQPRGIGLAATSWSESMALIPPWQWPGGPVKRFEMVAVPRTVVPSNHSSTSGRAGLQGPMIGFSGIGSAGRAYPWPGTTSPE